MRATVAFGCQFHIVDARLGEGVRRFGLSRCSAVFKLPLVSVAILLFYPKIDSQRNATGRFLVQNLDFWIWRQYCDIVSHSVFAMLGLDMQRNVEDVVLAVFAPLSVFIHKVFLIGFQLVTVAKLPVVRPWSVLCVVLEVDCVIGVALRRSVRHKIDIRVYVNRNILADGVGALIFRCSYICDCQHLVVVGGVEIGECRFCCN